MKTFDVIRICSLASQIKAQICEAAEVEILEPAMAFGPGMSDGVFKVRYAYPEHLYGIVSDPQDRDYSFRVEKSDNRYKLTELRPADGYENLAPYVFDNVQKLLNI